ncbi:MAG: DUF2971 domain-containing protein [Bacteroidetes bacterium]|nr:DUF2971 domain-containing protein [Bacteroidota bacterium]
MKFIQPTEPFVYGLAKKVDQISGNYSRNLIHLSIEDLDLPIYRIFTFERLKQIFSSNALCLVRPSMWDDPFENWLLRSKFILDDNSEAYFLSNDSFVGQCWSLLEESDAMWRIYSPCKGGIKVKTTIRKLLLSLINNGIEDRENEYSKFIAKVKYLNVDAIKQEFQYNADEYIRTNIGQAKTHSFKRSEFAHENEVRLLFKKENGVANGLYNLSISPNELFDEIVIDPRCKEIIEVEKQILELGYEGPVTQSSLYKFMDIEVKILFQNSTP